NFFIQTNGFTIFRVTHPREQFITLSIVPSFSNFLKRFNWHFYFSSLASIREPFPKFRYNLNPIVEIVGRDKYIRNQADKARQAASPIGRAAPLKSGCTLLGFTPSTLLALVGVKTPSLIFRATKRRSADPSRWRRTT